MLSSATRYPSKIGMTRCAIAVEKHLFGSRVDDAVVFAVAAIDVFFDDEPAATLVDLALVVITLGGNEGRATVHLRYATHPVMRQLASWTVAECTRRRVDLLDVLVGPEVLAHVEDGFHRLRIDVVLRSRFVSLMYASWPGSR